MALARRIPESVIDREPTKWGPDFDTYFETFDKSLDKAFDNYLASRETTSIAYDGLIPLAVLETMLTVGDNMHKVQYQHGNKSLPVLMDTVRRYTELNNSGIFDYYYGYLCMRHIMRTVCIGTLIESETFEDFLNSLSSDEETVEVTEALAEEAFGILSDYLFENDISAIAVGIGLQSPNWDRAFTCVGGLDFDDARFLISILWKNRSQLITLIEHGMLPGFPAFLFTLSEMTLLSKIPQSTKPWGQLQEIILRAFLVGTREERKTMRQLALYAHHRILEQNIVLDSTTDEEDARTVVRAYVDMFNPFWNYDKSLAPIMLLDIANILFRFVDSLLTSELADCIPDVAKSALERIWLEIDRENDGFMPAPRRGFTRKYAADIFHFLPDMRNRLLTNVGDDQAFSNMLLEVDILGLAGRVLLMVSREGSNPDEWQNFRDDLVYLCDAMTGTGQVPDELAYPNVANWVKVRNQLDMLTVGTAPSRVLKRHLLEAGKSWEMFGPPHQEVPWEPRQIQITFVESVLGRSIVVQGANKCIGDCALLIRMH
ncbi:hypothetical protein RhiJN_20200 [Ceratobasidium sp. AG-Ba]|nr:hypothetical protein RhiJN_20200 [Ceratobasidium sp. AG-Ba]